jgi:hypothetical protein
MPRTVLQAVSESVNEFPGETPIKNVFRTKSGDPESSACEVRSE